MRPLSSALPWPEVGLGDLRSRHCCQWPRTSSSTPCMADSGEGGCSQSSICRAACPAGLRLLPQLQPCWDLLLRILWDGLLPQGMGSPCGTRACLHGPDSIPPLQTCSNLPQHAPSCRAAHMVQHPQKGLGAGSQAERPGCGQGPAREGCVPAGPCGQHSLRAPRPGVSSPTPWVSSTMPPPGASSLWQSVRFVCVTAGTERCHEEATAQPSLARRLCSWLAHARACEDCAWQV